ncbi:MAG TPA: HNH endonuclease signature motif containing protein, partial [Bacillota bacterium]|nr:HNH endonuclease signature motif containing protein [Bacillota bacterium]
ISQKGRKVSQKTKEKIRKSLIGHNVNKETREKISLIKRGRKESDEIRKAKSKRMKREYFLGIRKKAMKGKTHSEESKKKISEGIRLEKHWNWLGGKSFEPYTKEFNNKFKRAIRRRDNQICMLCRIHQEKEKRTLNIHHINYDKKLSIPENCVTLCNNCNVKANFNRKYWIKFFQSLLSERYGYTYKTNNIVLEVSKCLG